VTRNRNAAYSQQISQKEHDSFIQELFTTSPLASPLLSSITEPCTSFPTSQDSTELEMMENNENKELHDARQSIDKYLEIKIWPYSQRLELALTDISESYRSYHTITYRYGVSKSTLCDRYLQQHRPKEKAHQGLQKLTPIEETELYS
jgi:hypothetical protein